jgi:aspartate/glutamate racemase
VCQLIHIAEETVLEVSKLKLKKVALPGTKYTMELDFYKKLAAYVIIIIIPIKQIFNTSTVAFTMKLVKMFFAGTEIVVYWYHQEI